MPTLHEDNTQGGPIERVASAAYAALLGVGEEPRGPVGGVAGVVAYHSVSNGRAVNAYPAGSPAKSRTAYVQLDRCLGAHGCLAALASGIG